jgi:outer membrane biosynthesis protein TonB
MKMPDENTDFDTVLGAATVAEKPAAIKAVADALTKKAKVPPKPAAKVPPKPAAKPAAKAAPKAPVKAAAKAPVKAAAKAPVKAAAKAPAKPAKVANGTGKAVDGSRRGERTGEYSAAVTTAYAKLKNLRAGTSLSTRELAEKHADLELKPWAFKAAALRLSAENGCKIINKDRINTVTRL